MLEFFTWGTNTRLLITLFFAFCVLFQSASFVFSRYRSPKTRLHTCESLLELALLLQIFCLSLLYGHVYTGFDCAIVAPMGYGALRIFAFACVAGTAVAVFLQGRTLLPLLTILTALVTLPATEAAVGSAYPYLYLLSLTFLLIRSVCLSLLRYREIRTELSAFSVKEAIDNLHTGILFCREDGRILLKSHRMQQLIIAITGDNQRSGLLFYERLVAGFYDDAFKRAELNDRTVCLLPDGTAWLFTKTDLHIGGRTYVQLTASDVTERYRLTAELQAQGTALQQRSEELRQAIKNLQDLSREQELSRAKMRAHDVLGRRLTVLLRMVRGDQALDIPLLKSLSEGLLEELSVRPEIPMPSEALADLRQVFGAIGVQVRFDGELPEDNRQAHLLVDVIKEGVSNAVRHGFATEVQVSSSFANDSWQMHISNNGHPPAQPITEGGGIVSIRKKLAATGGSLAVNHTPQFALSVTLPGGEV